MCQLHMKMYKRQQQRLYTTSKRWRSTKKSDKSDPSGGGCILMKGEIQDQILWEQQNFKRTPTSLYSIQKLIMI